MPHKRSKEPDLLRIEKFRSQKKNQLLIKVLVLYSTWNSIRPITNVNKRYSKAQSSKFGDHIFNTEIFGMQKRAEHMSESNLWVCFAKKLRVASKLVPLDGS